MVYLPTLHDAVPKVSPKAKRQVVNVIYPASSEIKDDSGILSAREIKLTIEYQCHVQIIEKENMPGKQVAVVKPEPRPGLRTDGKSSSFTQLKPVSQKRITLDGETYPYFDNSIYQFGRIHRRYSALVEKGAVNGNSLPPKFTFGDVSMVFTSWKPSLPDELESLSYSHQVCDENRHKTTFSPTIYVTSFDERNEIYRFTDDRNDGSTKTGIVLIGTETRPIDVNNKIVCQTTTDNFIESVDVLLHRYVYQFLKEDTILLQKELGLIVPVPKDSQVTDQPHVRPLATRLAGRKDIAGATSSKNRGSDSMLEIKELHSEIMGLYHRSHVPVYEKPPEIPENIKLDKVVEKNILDQAGVIGTGYRFSILTIYVKEDILMENRHEIENALRANGIQEYKIQVVSDIAPLSGCQVGSLIKSNLPLMEATVGCFAQQIKQEQVLLHALVSNHFAKNVGSSSKLSVGSAVLASGNESIKVSRGALDIAAVQINPNTLELDLKLKTVRQQPKRSQLFRFNEEIDNTYLKGLCIHLHGARTSPGLGIISIPDFTLAGSIQSHVLIEDRDEEKPLCQAGDSGAILCDDIYPYRPFMFAISMLQGEMMSKENGQRTYISVRLDDGLQQLSEEHDGVFNFCDDI